MRSYMSDHRTPLAWRHRDMQRAHHRLPPSPSVMSSSSDETVRRPWSYNRRSQFSDHYPFRSGGTLRSTRSVPALALATWDGEPCPVHGHGVPLFPHRRHGSSYDVRYLGYHPLEKKSFHGSMVIPPPYLVPPLMRPRPFVIPAEPLPMRDPYRSRSKAEDPYGMDQVCCKGHLIVLWIILAVVTIGVILGIILGVTIA